jgi:hypothetical protein
MKFTSIVITALVASTQFSSIEAATAEANDDEASTIDSQFVIIDVLANDFADQTDDPMTAVAATGNGAISAITLTTVPASGSAAPTDEGGGMIKYIPKSGFVGTETFTYTFTESLSSDTDTATVTVTVGPTSPFTTFTDIKFPVIGNKEAVDFTKQGIFDAAGFTAGAADPEPIVAPVFGNFKNFGELTSFEATKKTNDKGFLNFFNIFRGGN